MLKNKQILVSGASGFIGANLLRLLISKEAKISALTNTAGLKWRLKGLGNKIKRFNLDLSDYRQVKKAVKKIKPEIIFHTAVYGGYPAEISKTRIFKTNTIGTANLISACLENGFDLFVNTGSSSEYGLKKRPIKETDILEPINDYAESKALATLFCHSLAKKAKVNVVTLRLFSPYGYFEQLERLIPSVIVSCLKKNNPKVSTPKPVRDFIFIEDVLEAYLKVIKNKDKVKGEIFNIGYGKQYRLKEVVDKIIVLTGNKVKPRWGSISNPRCEPEFWQANILKAKDVLGWEPKYSLEKGLGRTIKWFTENMALYSRFPRARLKS